MAEDDRWQYIQGLDDELLLRGVMLSEWCTFIVKDADLAFVHGAFLSSIITSLAAVETYLRAEYGAKGKDSLANLISDSPLDESLKNELHYLRKYRNEWVHVDAPWRDGELVSNPDSKDKELEEIAKRAGRAMRQVIYSEQWT